MSKQKDGGSVFPMIDSDVNTAGERYFFPAGGMSLRDWFAGMALAGSMADSEAVFENGKAIASFCYRVADAMIEEREK